VINELNVINQISHYSNINHKNEFLTTKSIQPTEILSSSFSQMYKIMKSDDLFISGKRNYAIWLNDENFKDSIHEMVLSAMLLIGVY